MEVTNETRRLHRKIIETLPSRQACEEMVQFIEKIKGLLDDDQRTTLDRRTTLEHLLQRYRVNLSLRNETFTFILIVRISEWK